MLKISVIIPTLNAEREIQCLISLLNSQSIVADEIIVIDSESDDKTVEICRNNNVRVLQVRRKDFDHGRTRDYALKESVGDIVVFLTQDAVPVNEFLLENLITPLKDERVVVSTGRQIPKKDATLAEKLIRTFNYPSKSCIKKKSDLQILGIKTFFCSDVCAAYNKDMYLKLGGFEYPIKTNEDMFFAAKVINCGYRVAYEADALVYHSHNFSFLEQFRRNYIQGYELERHKDLLCCVSQKSEGMRLVKFVSLELIKYGHILSFLRFGFDCIARFLGSMMGKRKYENQYKKKSSEIKQR